MDRQEGQDKSLKPMKITLDNVLQCSNLPTSVSQTPEPVAPQRALSSVEGSCSEPLSEPATPIP